MALEDGSVWSRDGRFRYSPIGPPPTCDLPPVPYDLNDEFLQLMIETNGLDETLFASKVPEAQTDDVQDGHTSFLHKIHPQIDTPQFASDSDSDDCTAKRSITVDWPMYVVINVNKRRLGVCGIPLKEYSRGKF